MQADDHCQAIRQTDWQLGLVELVINLPWGCCSTRRGLSVVVTVIFLREKVPPEMKCVYNVGRLYDANAATSARAVVCRNKVVGEKDNTTLLVDITNSDKSTRETIADARQSILVVHDLFKRWEDCISPQNLRSYHVLTQRNNVTKTTLEAFLWRGSSADSVANTFVLCLKRNALPTTVIDHFNLRHRTFVKVSLVLAMEM